MELHEKDINKSINLNIIGTANVTMACSQKNIKLIYFSTNYVYPGINGNYNEDDPLKPFKPDEDHAKALPLSSHIVIIVLLKEETI